MSPQSVVIPSWRRAVLAIALLLAPLALMADKTPRSIATDVRIRQVMYSANEVYEILGTYGYQTVIEFSESEEIKLVAIGDSIAWQAVPAGSRLFLKPVEPDTATNLTITTDKRIYYFNLAASRNKSRESLTYTVRFIYNDAPISGVSTATRTEANAAVSDKAFTPTPKGPTDFNFNYQVSGSKEIALVRAFDDGQFTYLQFATTVDVPAVFVVDREGKESLVNSRVEGQYVVIERVASQFTLRNGSVVACLFNRNKPFADASFTAERRDLNKD